ncbi:MAG: hypothetical protein JWN84_4092, partial [Nocardioides sp.]|nr:hypothetical protein [Nocardioides sp.]
MDDVPPTRSLPVEPHPTSYAAAGAQAAPTTQPAGRWQRVRERAWSLRAVVAVALASVLLGGVGGAALAGGGASEDSGGRAGR